MPDPRRPAPDARPVTLTIAGSDSGGGAGIQADLETMEACVTFVDVRASFVGGVTTVVGRRTLPAIENGKKYFGAPVTTECR